MPPDAHLEKVFWCVPGTELCSPNHVLFCLLTAPWKTSSLRRVALRGHPSGTQEARSYNPIHELFCLLRTPSRGCSVARKTLNFAIRFTSYFAPRRPLGKEVLGHSGRRILQSNPQAILPPDGPLERTFRACVTHRGHRRCTKGALRTQEITIQSTSYFAT